MPMSCIPFHAGRVFSCIHFFPISCLLTPLLRSTSWVLIVCFLFYLMLTTSPFMFCMLLILILYLGTVSMIRSMALPPGLHQYSPPSCVTWVVLGHCSDYSAYSRVARRSSARSNVLFCFRTHLIVNVGFVLRLRLSTMGFRLDTRLPTSPAPLRAIVSRLLYCHAARST